MVTEPDFWGAEKENSAWKLGLPLIKIPPNWGYLKSLSFFGSVVFFGLGYLTTWFFRDIGRCFQKGYRFY